MSSLSARVSSSVAARRLGQVSIDAALVALSYFLAFSLRFDNGIPLRYEELLAATIGPVVAGKLLLFAVFGLYHKLWRFVDQKDFETILRAVVVASLAIVGGVFLTPPGGADPPRGVIALDFLLTLLALCGSRFLVRAIADRSSSAPVRRRDARDVLVV